jgi:hypothetical protein
MDLPCEKQWSSALPRAPWCASQTCHSRAVSRLVMTTGKLDLVRHHQDLLFAPARGSTRGCADKWLVRQLAFAVVLVDPMFCAA